MSMLCRSYAGAADAHAAVDRLLEAGVPGDAVRVVAGEPPHDAREGRQGDYAGSVAPDAPVGAFAGMPHPQWEPMGTYADEGDDVGERRGSYADADRDRVTTFPGGVATERVASHPALTALLQDAGLDPAAVDASVAAVHAGRVLVLVDASAADALPDVGGAG